MIEWVVPVLLIPAAVLPIVLLLGFTGCDLVFKLREPPNFQNAFEATLTEDRQRRSRCIVQRIEPVRLSRSGTKVRLTIQRPASGDLLINALFISQAADIGDPYDAAGDLTPVLDAALAVTSDPGNGLLELDAVDYDFDHTKPLLLAFDIGSAGFVRDASNVPSTDARAFVTPLQDPPLHEAASADRQSGYIEEPRIYLVQRIDVA